MLEQLDQAREPELRTRTAMALAAVRAPSAYDALIGMLSDPLPSVQFHAVRGLRKLGRAEAADALVAFYRSVSVPVAGRTSRSLVADAAGVLTALRLQVETLRALTELDAPHGLRFAEVAVHAVAENPLHRPYSL